MKNVLKLLLSAILGGLIAVAIYIGITTLIMPLAAPTEETGGTTTVKEITVGENVSIPDIVAKTKPSVVQIINEMSNGRMTASSLGSGVIIDAENGYVVTNFHVVSSSGNLTIHLPDGRITTATRVGGDPDADLAVLQLEDKTNLTAIPLGDSSKLQVGQLAIAIGSPLNIDFANTVTTGIISALERDLAVNTENGPTILSVIQTDAAINSGNSGGALIDSSGNLIGINSAKISSEGVEGLGFAIPVNTVKEISEEIIQTGSVTRPHLGVGNISAITPEEAAYYNVPQGIYVGGVVPGGAADDAGIVAGDIITQVDGVDVTSVAKLRQVLFEHKPGEQVTMNIYRNGNGTEITVTLQ